ncbi:class I SAM-dependent methyltransferase [Desulfovibrio sp. OttesenSCG-928-A18]|nr:class I SAM-dependent methyltransferase [Desulfovibrio sp. OttesenSCG-928-A18]
MQNRYQAWLESSRWTFALERCQDLLHCLLSGWPRRSRSVLVMGAGSGAFVETLWESGFDVTAQDNDPDFLALARQRLGSRADFVLGAPDHLPFDDCAFDYAVAAGAMEFWSHPEAVLKEMGRLSCSGIIVIFPNAWSLFGLECRLRPKHPLCAVARPLLQSPWQLARLLSAVFGKKRRTWASVLPGPSISWGRKGLRRYINMPRPRLPLGAFAGVRVDFGPLYTGTPLILRASEPAASIK